MANVVPHGFCRHRDRRPLWESKGSLRRYDGPSNCELAKARVGFTNGPQIATSTLTADLPKTKPSSEFSQIVDFERTEEPVNRMPGSRLGKRRLPSFAL